MVNVAPGAKTVLSEIDCEIHSALFTVDASTVKLVESVAVTLTVSVEGLMVAWVGVEVGGKVAVGGGEGVTEGGRARS